MATNDQKIDTTDTKPAEAAGSTTSSTASSQEPPHRRLADFGLPFQSQNAGTRIARFDFITPADYPAVESPANILVPLHFTSPRMDEQVHEPGHLWYDAFRTIQTQLTKICDSLKSGCSPVYGRIRSNKYIKGTKVLAFMILPESMGAWKEVEDAIKSLLEETFHGDGPPVRFYFENNPAVGW